MMATLALNELINDYTNEKFCEVIWFFSYKALNFFIISSDKLDKKRNIGKFFCRLLIINSFSTSSAKFSEFNAGNASLIPN